MELVYLWVEEYKNIHEQGFNFSSRFYCEYNDKTKKLIICDKKDTQYREECKKYYDEGYTENFFGDKINVTAIVGKNGSGKSSVLESIIDILAKNPKYNSSSASLSSFHTLLYFKDNQLYGYNIRDKDVINKTNIKFTENKNEEYLLECIDDLITVNINSEYKEIITRDTQQIFNENNKYEKNSSNLSILENYIYNKKQISKIKENFFIPDTLKISIKSMGYFSSILYEDRDYYSDEDWNEITDLIKSLKNKLFKEYLKILEKIFQLKKEKKHHKSYLFSLIENRKTPNYYFNAELLKDIPKIFQKYKINEQIPINSMNKEDLKYIKKLPYVFEFDLVDKNNINIDSLSFGEKQLLIQLHYILKYSSMKEYEQFIEGENNYINNEFVGYEPYYKDVNINNVLIFLDELEIGLHPEWQRKSINYIVDFLKEFTDINFHLILTSHSPFLLSDIPKQNIIFLDKEENGNCKVLNHDEVLAKKQTFGANIHTLLSDSFFMEDGLMGEFAKSKINEIIDFHKTVQKKRHINCLKKIYLAKRKDKFWQTQSIIGEEYLKQVIKNHLVEIEKVLLGKDGAKKEEIVRVEAYLESLKK